MKEKSQPMVLSLNSSAFTFSMDDLKQSSIKSMGNSSQHVTKCNPLSFLIQDQKNNPEPLEYAAYFKDTALSFRF